MSPKRKELVPDVPKSYPKALQSERSSSHWRVFVAAGLIVAAGLLAYCNSFSGPFIFDDDNSILDNPTIRKLWPPWQALSPPAGGDAVRNRPIVNFSLAINYALGGTNVWGYHATNLGVHLLL